MHILNARLVTFSRTNIRTLIIIILYQVVDISASYNKQRGKSTRVLISFGRIRRRNNMIYACISNLGTDILKVIFDIVIIHTWKKNVYSFSGYGCTTRPAEYYTERNNNNNNNYYIIYCSRALARNRSILTKLQSGTPTIVIAICFFTIIVFYSDFDTNET